MTDHINYVTEEGLKKIQDELYELKHGKRREIAERIAEAKELGDLSENAEYTEAKEEQSLVETRILELEQMLKNVEVIKHRKNTKMVQIGSKVQVKIGKQEMEFTIVGSSEADPAQQRISNESPIGQAILGAAVGEKVMVETPSGQVQYSIIAVE